MARLTLLSISLALFCATIFVKCDNLADELELSNLDVDLIATRPTQVNFTKTIEETKDLIKTVDGIQNLNDDFSPRSFLQPHFVTTPTTRTTITYKLGHRVSGDRVVATNSQSQKWSVAQNVTQNITYPRSGIGSVITYIQIIVDQSSNLGRGYVTSGGIGQRQISITLEAYKTLLFNQSTTIYGY